MSNVINRSNMSSMSNVSNMRYRDPNRDVNEYKLYSAKICMMMTNRFNFVSKYYMTHREYVSNVSNRTHYGDKYNTGIIMSDKRTV